MRPGPPSPVPAPLWTLQMVVDTYRGSLDLRADLGFHAAQDTLKEALELVASWKDRRGVHYPSMRKLAPGDLVMASVRVRALWLGNVEDFEGLFRRVERGIGEVPRIDDQAIYETALHIGAFLGLLPRRVYLHSGTRGGARALGLDRRRGFVPLNAFPVEMHALEPCQVVELLCLHAKELGQAVHAPG